MELAWTLVSCILYLKTMLKHISLENFRSHRKYDLDLGHTNILIGPNGAGKTNILEAFSVLSFCRSFRMDDKKNIINIKSEYCRVVGDDLEVFMSRYPRLILKVKIKGTPKKLSDFIGYLPAVVFSPETVSIITGAPGDRRRFLDIMISQVDKEYLIALSNIKKIRQQRNSLLQNIAKNLNSPNELAFWDKEFCRESQIILDKRGESIKFLNDSIPQIYKEISDNNKDKFSLNYINNFEGDLMENMERGRARDIAYGGTIYGPHRDDLVFLLNNQNMANFASRGELKSAILAIKMVELLYLEKNRNAERDSEKPILLLDDIFSEFDPKRRDHLAKLILQYQSVITVTERGHVPNELLKEANIIEIK